MISSWSAYCVPVPVPLATQTNAEAPASLTVGPTSEKKTHSFTGSNATKRKRSNERGNEGTRSL